MEKFGLSFFFMLKNAIFCALSLDKLKKIVYNNAVIYF